ncbi:hypothetical protein MaudCBS49596_005313 [Microsporum audouinii]
MKYILGKPLNIIWKDLSEDQKTNICLQINGYLAQFRKLTGDRIMAVDDGALDVGLYERRWLGPFNSVKEFHHSLAKGEPNNLGDDHTIHFAHADIAPGNIIVDENTGRINAIVDWERAGWYPEYWDFVRMDYDRPTMREMGGYTKLWKSLFTHIYADERSAMMDLNQRTVVPYPDGNLLEPLPDILPSFASHAKQLQKSFEILNL